ncbi:Hypothetical_protein [Hexamita inflata]|uniref:Hypothetical_protein n=1 Tax=Hexamita inflata TaxID=28002 RepID=A0AA86NY27_9EUKA|nr:Hypothetical protein HINF_LOCUS14471 [Hexamita inflata]
MSSYCLAICEHLPVAVHQLGYIAGSAHYFFGSCYSLNRSGMHDDARKQANILLKCLNANFIIKLLTQTVDFCLKQFCVNIIFFTFPSVLNAELQYFMSSNCQSVFDMFYKVELTNIKTLCIETHQTAFSVNKQYQFKKLKKGDDDEEGYTMISIWMSETHKNSFAEV